MKIDMLEIKKERLEEIRKQLKRNLRIGQYSSPASNMLKVERENLKRQIKEIEACRSKKI